MAVALYSNGYVPKDKLVVFNTGYNVSDGYWYWGLPPATYDRHNKLVTLARSHTGKTLSPSQGWSCYRPYAAQVLAKKIHGIYAATPGTSSHGGYWENQNVMAIDYHNWSAVYSQYGTGARARFYQDVKTVGMTPGLISTARGYPDEPWHVVDLNPWSGGSVAGGGGTPIENKEGFLMALSDAQQGHIYDALVNSQGSFYYKTDAIINIIREEIKKELLVPIQAGYIKYPGANYHAFQALANQSDGLDKKLNEVLVAVKAGGITPEQLQALAEVIAAKVVSDLPQDTAPSADEVATAVRAKFKSEPLT